VAPQPDPVGISQGQRCGRAALERFQDVAVRGRGRADLSAAMAPGAAQVSGCPADSAGWQLGTVGEVAADFFPHLFPDQWASVTDFDTGYVAPFDRNDDGLMCSRVLVSDNNPNPHWYRLGIEVLGEPTQSLTSKDNSGNANAW
jgi:hypothetical protein